ncbi:MAG: lysophospholipase L1-like esterase [Limisphaerales bacterium]|jgi:lysophospholipase L1-like esterase
MSHKTGPGTPLTRFREKARRNPNATAILAEGDSWFALPRLIRTNVVDLLSLHNKSHAAWLNLASNGDEARHMMEGKQYENFRRIMADEKNPMDAILFSGGGNDIVGKSLLPMLNEFEKGMTWRDAINKRAFSNRIKEIENAYLSLIDLRDSFRPGVKIFTHSYDLAKPSGKPIRILFIKIGPWVKKHMVSRGITDVTMQQKILTHMLTSFRRMLERLAQNQSDVFLAPTQGVLNPDTEWKDEIHPTAEGFAKIADVFQTSLRAHFPALPAADEATWKKVVRGLSPDEFVPHPRRRGASSARKRRSK